MLRAVDANKHELIFHAGRGDFVGIKADGNLPGKEIVDRKRPRKIA